VNASAPGSPSRVPNESRNECSTKSEGILSSVRAPASCCPRWLRFNTIGEAIHTVASSLAHGRAYRGKDIGGKLAAYNQGTDYPAMVLEIMRQIAPRPQVQSAD